MDKSYTVLIVEDNAPLLRSLKKYFETFSFRVLTAEDVGSAIQIIQKTPLDIIVSDWRLPDRTGSDILAMAMERDPNMVFILMTGYAEVEVAVDCLRNGAYHYITKPFTLDSLLEIVKAGIVEKLFFRDIYRNHIHTEDLPSNCPIIGQSPPILKIKNLIHMVKDLATTVLITGETGTGKELVARAIHYSGRRKEKPLLCINCGAIPDDLLEEELFGHVKGAYTGATQSRKGYFEMADGGSIFLDEIGNMGHRIQQKLLRVLEERRITPLGTTRSVDVDVRIIAATNSDLVKMVERGSFREDLYYRLKVFPVELPPLRDRREDIPILAQYFAGQMAEREGIPAKRISDNCLARLSRYDWPGNIRELRNAVEYAMIVSGREKVIEIAHFNIPGVSPTPEEAPALEDELALPTVVNLDEGVDFSAIVQGVERKLLLEGLRQAGGNKQKAAKLLNMKRTTLVEKLKRLDVDNTEN